MDFEKILWAVLVLVVLGLVLGLLIAVVSKVFKVEEDTRVEEVLALLPGANCGGCGFPGCSGMADAIVNNGANPRNCKPIKQEKVDEINSLMTKFNEEQQNQ